MSLPARVQHPRPGRAWLAALALALTAAPAWGQGGTSPGLTRVRNLDITPAGLLSGMSNATGVPGSADPNGFSGWGVFEYGTVGPSGGSATITATTATPATFTMQTVSDVPPRKTPAPPANFDAHQPYSWVVIRPVTNATASDPTNFTPLNATAPLQIDDTSNGTGVDYSSANGTLTNALLNQYLRFDATQWDWGTTPPAERGTFSFSLQPDTLGNPDRVVALNYSPVPEPGTLLAAAAAGLGLAGAVRRARRTRGAR